MIDYNPTEQVNPNIKYDNRCRLYLLPSVNLLKSVSEIAKIQKNITAVTTKMERWFITICKG